MAKKGKSKKTVSMPGLGDVETFKTVPEGDYHVKVSDVEQKEGQKADYLNWELTIVGGPNKGQKLWYITSFAENSLWNLKAWLEAMEADIPEEPEDVAINDYIGLELSVSVTHEEYEGKDRAKVTDFSVLEGEGEEDVAVEEEDDEDGESETYTEEQVKDMDDDELKDLIKKHKLGIKLKEYKTAKKKRNAVIDALEEAELIAEEDE
jgi:hypothetical protein